MSDTATTGGRDSRPMMTDTRPPEPVAAVETRVADQAAWASEGSRVKVLRAGGEDFACAGEIPALLLADLIDQQADLQREMGDEARGDKVRAMIAMLDFFVLDGELERLKGRMRDKENPVGFQEIMPEIERLLPLYMGGDVGKAPA